MKYYFFVFPGPWVPHLPGGNVRKSTGHNSGHRDKNWIGKEKEMVGACLIFIFQIAVYERTAVPQIFEPCTVSRRSPAGSQEKQNLAGMFSGSCNQQIR